jgi:glycosyltransferase involved in cell wall biosynthesis
VPVHFRRQYAAANMTSMLAFLPEGVRGGRKILATDSVDVINTHFVLPSGPVGDWLARHAAVPHVITAHGGDLYDPSKKSSPHRHAVLRAWIRQLLGRADDIVVQSRNTGDNMHRYYGQELQAERIPLGLPRPVIPTTSREHFGLTASNRVLTTVGRLVGRKALPDLVQLVRDLQDSEVRLMIVGSGPLEMALRKQAADLGVEKQVRFMGFLSDEEKFGLLQTSDLFVSTSQHEGFGLVFLEAMAAGLPVVCYDHGGQTDFLTDRENGRVLPLNDREAFTEGVRELLHDTEQRVAMGRRNEGRVEGYFIDTCASRYESLFRQVLARRSGAAAMAVGSK